MYYDLRICSWVKLGLTIRELTFFWSDILHTKSSAITNQKSIPCLQQLLTADAQNYLGKKYKDTVQNSNLCIVCFKKQMWSLYKWYFPTNTSSMNLSNCFMNPYKVLLFSALPTKNIAFVENIVFFPNN